MPKSSALTTVTEFWRLMGTNDFRSVALVLDEQFLLEWPQSNDRIRGALKFAAVNEEYKAYGTWAFSLKRLVATDLEVVSEVDITDGVQKAKAISFFTVHNGKITKLVEFWPEPFEAPASRAHLVEHIQ